MKIAVVYGTAHHGITYDITRKVLEQLSQGDVKEFFLPQDFGAFCLGCGKCFQSEGDHPQQACPHWGALQPIVTALEESDLMILVSPVYVFHVTGQMKAFLDHFGCRWMVHRPDKTMFRKCALLITAAAGAGMEYALRDFQDNMYYWGVGTVLSYGKQVRALYPADVSQKIQKQIEQDAVKLAKQCRRAVQAKKTRRRVKWMFYKMRVFQKLGINPVDQQYWHRQGWIGKARPWKLSQDKKGIKF